MSPKEMLAAVPTEAMSVGDPVTMGTVVGHRNFVVAIETQSLSICPFLDLSLITGLFVGGAGATF